MVCRHHRKLSAAAGQKTSVVSNCATLLRPKYGRRHFYFSSNPEGLPDSYLRYLTNSLRDTFDFGGVPIRITVRKTGNPYADND